MLYKDAGVDLEKAERLVALIRSLTPRSKENIGPFAALYDLKEIIKDYREPIFVTSCDGVGSKTAIAKAVGRFKGIGQDLVAMVVNDLVTSGATPLFLLDYYATDKLDLNIMQQVMEGIVEACREINCVLIGGETAELPGILNDGFDVAGFGVGIVEKKNIPKKDKVRKGDIVIGLSSSGIHANGFSLIRKIIENGGISYSQVFPEVSQRSIGEVLLDPTKVYVNTMLELFKYVEIKAAAHITGGGIPGNLSRVITSDVDVVIDKTTWLPKSIFKFLQILGNIPEHEMLRVFNMGLGFIIIVSQHQAYDVEEILKRRREKFYLIGKVVAGNGQVIIE